MSLREEHDQGFRDALARYGVKEAAFSLKPMWHPEAGMGTQVIRSLIGHPDVLMKEGLKPFRSGGPLSLGNMFWPRSDMHPVPKWLGRASTVMAALPVLGALRGQGDPNEGRLSNALSIAGGTLGSIYGNTALGMFGAPIVGALGAGAGKMVGRLLGSRPTPPPAPSMPVDPYYTQGGYY